MGTSITESDAILISNPTNIQYLTGFSGSNPDEHEAYLLITFSQIYLFTNSLYLIRARQCTTSRPHAGKQLPITVVQISRDHPVAPTIASYISKKNITSLGFESSQLTVSEFESLTKNIPQSCRLCHADGYVESFRTIKTSDEINAIQRACALTDHCYLHLAEAIHFGISETDIAWEITSFFHRNGARDSFAPVVAFGSHAAEPHAVPSAKRKLKTNEPILLDFGAEIDGYHSDMTRMIPAGKPTKEWTRAYRAVKEAQSNALQAIAHGERSGAALDTLAKTHIKKSGFIPYSHSLGHAVGLSIHENPRLTVKKDQILKPGMVVSIEPGIYIEGKFGIRIEDLILITAEGYELLSHAPYL